jgi:hypothetical protein
MTSHEDQLKHEPEWLQDAVTNLRAPVARSPGAVDAVVRAALAQPASRMAGPLPAPQHVSDDSPGLLSWFMRRRIVLSPLAAAAAAIVLIVSTLWLARSPARPAVAGAEDSAGTIHQFVLIAPSASSVSLVGDFNAWNTSATPLQRQGSAWTVEIALPPGRHMYSFVVDGSEWVTDASAARAPEDEFGRSSSVILVPRKRT